MLFVFPKFPVSAFKFSELKILIDSSIGVTFDTTQTCAKKKKKSDPGYAESKIQDLGRSGILSHHFCRGILGILDLKLLFVVRS